MANQSTTGFGLRAVERLGNTPAIQGQSKYQLQTAPGVALTQNRRGMGNYINRGALSWLPAE